MATRCLGVMGGLVVVAGCWASGSATPGAAGAADVLVTDAFPGAARGAEASPGAASAPRALDGAVEPVAYQLQLEIDPVERGYAGRVQISVQVARPTSTIWLHGEDLDVQRAVLRDVNGAEITLSRPAIGPGGLLGFAAGQPVEPGRHVLDIAFRAEFGTHVGVFRQSLGDDSYVFTDFQPIDARRAFPCFDEPRFKTPWSLSLVVPADLEALSNMAVARTTPAGRGRKEVRFATTEPLPTYLFAFAVGPFDLVDAPEPPGGAARLASGQPVPVRVVVPRGQAAHAQSAATMAPELLRVVSEHVDQPVPFAKLDFIAVPSFSGAMENPGLITVAASILLVDPERPAVASRRTLALVIAHELAHLWFGNLATPADWSELWLSEGFATWLAGKALHTWNPQHLRDLDQVLARAEAMAMDEHLDARAVREVGRERGDIEGAFDALSYQKAAAVLTMFERWLGEDALRDVAREYIAAHANSRPATTASWLRALARAATPAAAAAMATFLDQPGIPVIRAELRCGDGRPRMEISQRRYLHLYDRERASPAQAEQTWRVPVCVRYDKGPDAQRPGRVCTLLGSRRARLELDTERCPRWFIPNADAAGYFRYDMPPEQLVALAHAPLTDGEAADLVYNLRALLHSGDVEIAAVVTMLEALARTSSRHVTVAIIDLLGEIGDLLPAARPGFRALVQRLYGARARALGLVSKPGESEEDTLLRPALLAFVGRHGGDEWVRRTARRHADTLLRTERVADRDMAGVILGLAALDGDERLFDRIEARLRRLREPDADAPLFAALGWFRRPALVERSLGVAADASLGVGRHEIVRALMATPATRERALRFLEERTHELARSPAGAILLVTPLFGPDLCSERDLERARRVAGQLERARDLIADRVSHLGSSTRACTRFRAAHALAAERLFH